MLFLILAIDKGDILRLGKILREVVGSTGLNRLLVLNHCFHREGALGSGEPFCFGLLPHDHGDGEEVPKGVSIKLVDHMGLFESFLLGFVGGVAFLPKKLSGPQEKTGAHFPAHHVGPLVDQKGKVAIGFGPTGKGRSDNGLGGGADDIGFGEFPGGHHFRFPVFVLFDLEPVMSDHGTLGGKAFGVFGFLFQIGEGDKERKIGILVPGRLETRVEISLDCFPDCEAPGLYHHATAGL